MRTRVIAAVVGLAGAGALVATPAFAGHTNTLLEGNLTGRAQVAADGSKAMVGDANGKGSVYVFGIDGDPTTLCYVLEVSKIAETDQAPGNGRAAHIHLGAAGTNGPVEVNLAWPQDGQAADCLTEGEAGKGLDPGEVQRILAQPEAYYVNVHNTVFPNGAVRGQLHAGGKH